MELVEASGFKIAYQMVGEGPPLVLIHGAAEDSRIWEPQLAALADEFTVVAWDEPGAGRSSDLPKGFGLADFADKLAALLKALELGPAHIAGLSWGGTVLLELYRRHPGLVATLIMIDTYAGWMGSLPADEVQARVDGARKMLAASDEEFDATLPGLFANEPPGQFAHLLAAIAADVRPATLEHEVAIMAETDLTQLLPHIVVPTLLIWGQDDARSPLSVARQFEEAIPGSRLVVIESAGHLSNLERPARVNDALREFCRAHPPDSGYANRTPACRPPCPLLPRSRPERPASNPRERASGRSLGAMGGVLLQATGAPGRRAFGRLLAASHLLLGASTFMVFCRFPSTFVHRREPQETQKRQPPTFQRRSRTMRM